MVRHLDITITSALILTTIITGTITSSISVEAEDITDITDITDTASVTVPASCSMTATLESEHSASIPNGIYSGTELYPNGIGKTTIATFCNDNSGYAIYAIGYTGDKYDGEDHTKLIGATNGQKISTGTATSGSTSNWAMKLTKVTDSSQSYNPENLTITNGYDDYNVIPDTYTKVANYTSTTDQTLGSVLSTTYAAYISPTEVADTYTGKVKYTLVHPNTEVPAQPQSCTTGKICYFANVSDYEGTMADQGIVKAKDWSSCNNYTDYSTICVIDGQKVDIDSLPELDTYVDAYTLLPSNFSRTGYGFAGWSDKFDYATNPEAKFYGPNETITLNTADYTGTNPGLSLYAVWAKSQGSLQDSTKVASVCSSLTQAPIDGTANLASVSALTDQRDNNTYAIAKLADGKCWMIENLRLADKDSSNNDIELSATNTNSPSLPLTNIYDATNPTTSNHLSASTNPTSTAWCTNYDATCFDQSMLYTGNTTERGTSPTTDANTYSYGNYYNWYSATAGNGKYSTSTNNSTVAGDICPTGWTLPESGDKTNMAAEKNNFYKLGLSLGLSAPANYDNETRPYWTGSPEGSNASIAFRTYPNNFLYSSYVSGSSVDNRGNYGNYWSKSVDSNDIAYGLGFYSGHVGPSYSNDKSNGFSVRCLAQ